MYLKINKLEFNTYEDVDFLIELLAISNYPEDFSISNLKSSLYKIIEHDDNNIPFVEGVISRFGKVEPKKVRLEAIEFLYEYIAKTVATDEKLDLALDYCDKIFQINPKNKMAEDIIEYASFKKVMLSLYDMETLETFLGLSEKYPFLKTNKRYHISLAHLYGNIALMNYANKDITMATDYLKKFEAVMDDHNLVDSINKSLVADLYIKAGNYYYYKDKYQLSYNIFKKGLSYVPNHPDLIKKAQWSKEEL